MKDYTIGTFIDPDWSRHPLAQGDSGFPVKTVEQGHSREGEFLFTHLTPLHVGYEHEVEEENGFTLFVYETTETDDGELAMLRPLFVAAGNAEHGLLKVKLVDTRLRKWAHQAVANAELWFNLRVRERHS